MKIPQQLLRMSYLLFLILTFGEKNYFYFTSRKPKFLTSLECLQKGVYERMKTNNVTTTIGHLYGKIVNYLGLT